MFPPKIYFSYKCVTEPMVPPSREFLLSLKRQNHSILLFPEKRLRLPYQIREERIALPPYSLTFIFLPQGEYPESTSPALGADSF